MTLSVRKVKSPDILLLSIKTELEQAQSFTLQSVNFAMVKCCFTIEKWIIEHERFGQHLATCAGKTFNRLSGKLRRHFIKGYSVVNLENIRRFFLTYCEKSQLLIYETVYRKLLSKKKSLPDNGIMSQISSPLFKLSGPHYQVLIRIDNAAERNFYGIEPANEIWPVGELRRQINADLFTRLNVSRNKRKVRELSRKGLVIREPSDLIKDPHVPEFLGLKEREFYLESELENAINIKLGKFLPEPGKGFFFAACQKRITVNEKHLCWEKEDKLVKGTLPENNKQIFTSIFRHCFPKDEELQRLMEDVLPYDHFHITY